MLKVANIFSNDMVLQRDKNITVWGLGDEERTVTVTLNGVSVQTQVCDGRWTAVLPPMSAGGEYEMTVSDGCTEKKFCRIMIGEVWFIAPLHSISVFRSRKSLCTLPLFT